jgi:hypothetical protein
MDKKPLIGVSILAVVLLMMGSLSNVMGYQAVQTSQQNIIKERINQRELLFQTIVDIVNNKEIQRIILKSQMSRGMFPVSDIPVLTKNQLKVMYLIGLILSKIISNSRMHSMVEKYQLNNQALQKEINAVIEKDNSLNAEITQLQDSECDCENEINEEKISTTDFSDTPIICMFSLTVILGTGFFLSFDILMLILFPFALLIWIICGIAFSLYYIFGCGPEDPKNSS